MRTRCGFAFFLSLSMAAGLLAQSDSANLSGTVSDPSGAVVPNATVQATNEDTNVGQSTRTNSAGLYSFPSLAPGRYRISVKNTGFKESVRTDLTLHVGDTVSENFRMEVGSVTDSATVVAAAPTINTQDASVGTVVEQEFLQSMPLNGRSFQSLITITPGVNTVPVNAATQGQFVVNGQRADTNYFSVDGVSAMANPSSAGNTLSSGGVGAGATTVASGGYQNLASIDALQEFRITTSTFAPEFGSTPGGQISLVTRGGTNSFHGDAFDYLRNTVLDANDWFRNATAQSRPIVIQNDFGGVVGGPIIKNKLFFFTSYEGLRLQNPTPTSSPVPTASARALAAQATNNGVTGYMAQFLNAWALPTGNPSTPCTNTTTCIANDVGSFPGTTKLDAFSIRGDYNLSSKSNVFFRYTHTPSQLLNATTVDNNATTYGSQTYTSGWSYIFSSRATNDARFNYSYNTRVASALPINFSDDLTKIFPAGYAQPAAGYDLSNIAFAITGFTGGVTGFSLSEHSTNQSDASINILDTVSYVVGTHAIKFGFDFRQLTADVAQPAYNNGNNSFALLAGIPTPNLCTVGTLTGLPPYICGNASTVNLQHIGPTDFRFRQFAAYVQDTWKVNQRLSVTYGVRWQVMPSVASVNNAAAFAIQPSSFNLSNLKNLVIAPLGTELYGTRWADFSPRLGFAYQLRTDPKWGTVLRAGGGVFYDTGAQLATQSQGPYANRVNNTTAPNIFTFVPFPLAAGSPFTTPAPFASAAPFNDGSDILVVPNARQPYVYQSNFTIEQQLGQLQTLTVSYVGANGRNLVGDLNYPSIAVNPAQLGTGAGGTGDSISLFGNFGRSFYNALQTKIQRQVSHGLGILGNYTWSHSTDNASQNTLLAVYLPTPSQLSAGLPTTLERASSDFDVRHTVGFSVVYDVPTAFGSNRIAKAIVGKWSLGSIYHFQTALPMDLSTGASTTYLGLTTTERPNLIPGIPVYVSGAPCIQQNAAQSPAIYGCPGGKAINGANIVSSPSNPNAATAAQIAAAGCQAPTLTNTKGAFCTPLTQPLTVNGVTTQQAVSGDLARNTLRAYSLQQLDFSVRRTFPIHEKIRLSFEMNLFNVFNHPQFAQPAVAMSGANFGLPGSMANVGLLGSSAGTGFNSQYQMGAPRNFQLALKLLF